MKIRRSYVVTTGILALAAVSAASYVAFRSLRSTDVALDFRSRVRYLIQSGGTIGEAPASETFSDSFLAAIFGENPDLLHKLKGVVSQGVGETENISLGEVAAMAVTYRLNGNDQVKDVAAHVVGDFPLTHRKLGMHRDGYFKQLIDKRLWDVGNNAIACLGRDLVLFADPEIRDEHEYILESIFSGNVMPTVAAIEDPIYYTIVFPDPRHTVPRQLKNHVQAVVMKGQLGWTEGEWETIFICPSSKSASYTLSIVSDLKRMAELSLETKWKGQIVKKEWSDAEAPGIWWAYEMVQNLQSATLDKEENIVRIHTKFDRIMVNAVLKSIERMSRDIAQMRLTLDQKMDPRLADAKLRTAKPLHYWSEEHRWGPNWPISEDTNEVSTAVSKFRFQRDSSS